MAVFATVTAVLANELFTDSRPATIEVGPVYVLAPLSTHVVLPDFSSPTVPEPLVITPAYSLTPALLPPRRAV